MEKITSIHADENHSQPYWNQKNVEDQENMIPLKMARYMVACV